MGIRWNITDRATGKQVIVDNPVGREFVKDGVRKALPPKQDQCDGLMALIRTSSALGMRGGALA